MIGRRNLLLGLGAMPATWASAGRAQQPGLKRVGVMAAQPLVPIKRFRQRLQELGYVEGENLTIEYRFTEGRDELYTDFAAELVALPVDLIVVWGTPAALAAKQATTTIPILVGSIGDVVSTGIVKNLAHPEANITGFSALNVALEEKRLELLKQLLPHQSRVAVLAHTENPMSRVNLDIVREAAKKLSIAIDPFDVRSIGDIGGALRALTEAHPDAALITPDTLLLSRRTEIVGAMASHRIPAIYPFREYAEAGGMIIYGANLSILFERAAEYADKILKGEKPGNLPVQQATAFELILNLKVAGSLGLTMPPNVLVRADEVIE